MRRALVLTRANKGKILVSGSSKEPGRRERQGGLGGGARSRKSVEVEAREAVVAGLLREVGFGAAAGLSSEDLGFLGVSEPMESGASHAIAVIGGEEKARVWMEDGFAQGREIGADEGEFGGGGFECDKAKAFVSGGKEEEVSGLHEARDIVAASEDLGEG